MTSVFACPECGQELSVEGLSPGREVLCPTCSTSVEVPYFPRASGWKKRGRAPERFNPFASKLLRAAFAFSVVVLLGLAATRMIGGRVRSDRERVLNELVDSAGQAEGLGQYGVALREIEGALVQARAHEPEGSSKLLDLKARRDRISLLEARARLAKLDTLDPDRAVGEALILTDRARRDLALEPVSGAIDLGLAGSRNRQVARDLEAARREFEAGNDLRAFTEADRLHAHSGDLPRLDALRHQAEARSIIEALVSRSGAALPPIDGKFVAGSAESYATSLDRHRVEILQAHGYLPQPRRSTWSSVWDEKAAFRLAIHLVETREQFYLQSRNRTTLIDGSIELSRQGKVIWKARAVGQTRTPLPDLPAYLAGHLATSGQRNPEAERRLHDDALAQFADQAVKNLRNLPSREAAETLR